MKRVGRSFTALSAPESGPGGLGTQPQVQVSPQNIEVHEGDALRLYCRATGSPTPKLSWLKNGGRLPAQVRPGDPCTDGVLAWCRCSSCSHRGITSRC